MTEQIPDDSFLRRLDLFGVRDGRRVWREGTGGHARYYTWDRLHGEVEVFNGRGRHLGAAEALSGRIIKKARKDRRLNL